MYILLAEFDRCLNLVNPHRVILSLLLTRAPLWLLSKDWGRETGWCARTMNSGHNLHFCRWKIQCNKLRTHFSHVTESCYILRPNFNLIFLFFILQYYLQITNFAIVFLYILVIIIKIIIIIARLQRIIIKRRKKRNFTTIIGQITITIVINTGMSCWHVL